ncbi:elongation factor-2 kinase like protein [Thalassiosira pseudonana CCMP1335]|uniref:Elongation factor-2 kinase like protein n=1 Tax=Thalassiosira pseudonana TaxID=35128 RepID=B8BUU5_THAPS|nr:elongation factor-2 kinase like protein [Thalassiosira pseudonana CCMP1335]EED94821.1 elongation factor-2 kinase like protein [Thalassiosira pseudonana CCMP1335]
MTATPYNREEVQRSLREKIWRAAATAVSEEDPWKKHDITSIPAERVVRHCYNPNTRQFKKDETIVKVEKEPFTHGAMRHCFRLKKLATPPQSSSNHRFHSYGWSRALNYVAKCYLKEDGTIDTSRKGTDNVLTDIILQYEAAHWSALFNEANPPRKIDFIRAYAMEFVDRPGKPMFAVERYIAGNDSYGCGFHKHNTNSGFIDLEIRRKTPQVFSAHSFYASEGTRLVADVQGVGDLYTDPQVLSIDYRFGDGDLGPRGMALFFKTFRHCDMSDLLGIPIFPLSRNERRHQAKYDDEESTLSEASSAVEEDLRCRFKMLDANRQRRKTVLMRPIDIMQSEDKADTAKRSNISNVSLTIRQSMRQLNIQKSVIHRSKSDVDEITSCLQMAVTDAVFDHTAFHRYESGELKPRHFHGTPKHQTQLTVVPVKASPPMKITDETKANLGKVHYHLACLHGLDRFPEIVPTNASSGVEDLPSHDVFSVVFHLSHAASLYNVPACLSLARALIGLDSSVSPLLKANVRIDFELSKDLCWRGMTAQKARAAPKVAAGCLLYQILEDEGTTGDVEKMNILEETLNQMKVATEEEAILKEHANKLTRDEEALGSVNTDEECLFEDYELMAKLADLKVKAGKRNDARVLYQDAAELAMSAGKMKTANCLSMKAAQLEG